MIRNVFFVCLLFTMVIVKGQNSTPKSLEELFEEVSQTRPGLNDITEFDISGLTLFEVITSLAEAHKLNVSADNDLNEQVTTTFFDLKVKDVFIFLIQKYNLEVTFLNDIIIFKRKVEKPKVPEKKKEKVIDVPFNKQNNFLSIKLKNDSLPLVTQKITEVSGNNIVLSPEVKGMRVSSYILNRPFDQVIDMMAKSNDLVSTIDKNGFYFLSKNMENLELNNNRNVTSGNRRTTARNTRRVGGNTPRGKLNIELDGNGFLKINTVDTDATTLITEAADLINANFIFYDRPDEVSCTLNASSIDL